MSKTTFSLRIDLPDGSRFGPGKAALLASLIETGSIKAAASDLGMSYPRALKLIEQMNQSFADPLITTQHGGADGGGAHVTPTGHAILGLYQRICADAEHANLDSLGLWSGYLPD